MQTKVRKRNGGGRLARLWMRLLIFPIVLVGLIPQAQAAGPRPGDPVFQIPLEPLGFVTPAARLLALGGPQVTVHFVDTTHVLLTYRTRGLIKRLPGEEADDADGLVAALLLELPDGKVLARTEWHVHDRDTYLWALGHGRFLLRVQSRLTLLDPLGGLAHGGAFTEHPFGTLPRRIGYITVSPGGDLLTVETIPKPRPEPKPGQTDDVDLSPPDRRPPVQIFFFRLVMTEEKGKEELVRQSAGAVAAADLISVPANADGFISTAKESASVYLFDFHPHSGGVVELSPFDTTCIPHPYFVTRSEFVALGCRGTADKLELAGFNLKGENNWLEVLSGQQAAPAITSAPAAGRFAFSRTLLTGQNIDPTNIIPEEMTAQEITVRQSHDGRILLKVAADPIQRASQNFALAPDGMSLALVKAGNLNIYRLPELTAKDRAELKRAAAMEPARNEAMIRLGSVPAELSAEAEASKAPGAPAGASIAGAEPAGAVDPNPAPAQPPASEVAPVADAPANDNSARKPPSLYGPGYPKPPK